MFIKIADLIFRIKQPFKTGNPEYDDYLRPNHPTVYIDTKEQRQIIDRLFEAKLAGKERKITGYYFSTCFDYVYKNYKILSIDSKLVKGEYEFTARFYSHALNEKWSGRYKTSLYTIRDLRQMVPLKQIARSKESINKFSL